jgi:hypothetical protein
VLLEVSKELISVAISGPSVIAYKADSDEVIGFFLSFDFTVRPTVDHSPLCKEVKVTNDSVQIWKRFLQDMEGILLFIISSTNFVLISRIYIKIVEYFSPYSKELYLLWSRWWS